MAFKCEKCGIFTGSFEVVSEHGATPLPTLIICTTVYDVYAHSPCLSVSPELTCVAIEAPAPAPADPGYASLTTSPAQPANFRAPAPIQGTVFGAQPGGSAPIQGTVLGAQPGKPVTVQGVVLGAHPGVYAEPGQGKPGMVVGTQPTATIAQATQVQVVQAQQVGIQVQGHVIGAAPGPGHHGQIGQATQGRFSSALFEYACQCAPEPMNGGTWLMAWWCNCFLYARVWTMEFGKNFNEALMPMLACVAIMTIAGSLENLVYLPDGEEYERIASIGYWIRQMAAIAMAILLMNLRRAVREKYQIPEGADSCCGHAEDCCCSYWCTPCVVCQLMVHTNRAHGTSSGCDFGPPVQV